MKVSFFLLVLIFLTPSIHADFKPLPTDQAGIQKDPNQPSSINVSFNMGNSQEVPTLNAATASASQQIKVEHTHTSQPIPQESFFSRVTNSAVGGAAAALGAMAVTKIAENGELILDILKKIVLRG